MGRIQEHDPHLQVNSKMQDRQKLSADPLVAEPSASSSLGPLSEVTDTNPNTSNLEFYGASSSVSFLRHVESMSDRHASDSLSLGPWPPERSLTSLVHNSETRPPLTVPSSSSATISTPPSERFYFRVAQRLLDAYFTSLHHIQPLIDEESFMSRCESLWFDHPKHPPLSFIALYYATLSVGCLVTTSEDWDKHGCHRSVWSRKLLAESLNVINKLGSATDIEIAQCYYMIVSLEDMIGFKKLMITRIQSKVYQHELNPHGKIVFALE